MMAPIIQRKSLAGKGMLAPLGDGLNLKKNRGREHQAAEQRSELSPRRGFVSLGLGQLFAESREAATGIKPMLIIRDAIAPSGLVHFRWFEPKVRKASPWA
jgi:hypothetical protein